MTGNKPGLYLWIKEFLEKILRMLNVGMLLLNLAVSFLSILFPDIFQFYTLSSVLLQCLTPMHTSRALLSFSLLLNTSN